MEDDQGEGMTSRVLTVAAARDLGPQFVDNQHQMVGQDGAYSIPLGDETLWFFGDTLIGSRVPGESLWYPGGVPVGHADMSGRASIARMINNTGLLLCDQDGSDGLRNYRYVCDASGAMRTLIPLLPGQDPDWVRIWCLHGCAIGDLIYLYFIEVRMLESGPFPVNFDLVGSGLAVGDRHSLEFRRVSDKDEGLLWRAPLPTFASAVLNDPDGQWIYAYGVGKNEQGVQQVFVARVRPQEIADAEAYRYFSSSTSSWMADQRQATPVFTDAPNELSVSRNAHLGCYLAVHSLNLSGIVVGRTSPTPWGPWSAPVPLWHVAAERRQPLPYPTLIYAGKEHPHLSRENGRVIYLTFVEFEEYYPHLVEVELAG
jgi:hypothetical protein